MADTRDGTISIFVGEPKLARTIVPAKLRHRIVPDTNVSDKVVNRISTLSNGPSRARIGISHLSVPLAWNSDEYFGTRGEGKVYAMFVALQATNNVNDSRIVTAVDRTCTDVAFTDSFIFENQPVDFEIEIQLYASRTDGGDINQSLKQKLTRSFGRRFGSNYKTSWLSDDVLPLDPLMKNGGNGSNNSNQESLNNKFFHLLGRTTLTLSDAKPKTGIYDLHLSPNAANYGPPLYGHIRCRIVAQPNSVAMPLSDGILTVKPVGDDCLYQNMRCRLQAGVLRCAANNSLYSQDQALLHIYINKDSKVLPCQYQRSIVVTSDRYLAGTKRDKQFILTSDSEEDIAAWMHAISLQIADCEQWGEFAVSSIRLTVEPDKPDVVILSRTNGRRLYDEIQIQVNGTMHGILKTDTCSPNRHFAVDSSKMVSFAPTTKPAQTAPTGRRRNSRSHVRNLFQPINDGEYRYVINLPVSDVQALQKTNGSSTKLTTNCCENRIK
uniref:Anillin homology domain-containing protein n=1 Tax=Setaria digitata TaxID=48799 RepID=A0A915Q5F8_9BILA